MEINGQKYTFCLNDLGEEDKQSLSHIFLFRSFELREGLKFMGFILKGKIDWI